MSNFYTSAVLLGDDILIRGYEDGRPVKYREKSSPTMFLVPEVQSKKSKFKTLDGRYAHPKRFDGAREAREFIKQYEGAAGLEVHGYERFVYQHIAQKFPGEIDYDMSQMKIYTIDIEVACENGFPDVQASAEEMLCITIKDFNTKKIITWGSREFTPPKDVEYRVFWTEAEMLTDFHKWWVENTPDIITGWNNNLYDIPYICRRIERVLGEKWKKSLSPWNRVLEREIVIQGRTNLAYQLTGVAILDYLDLYKKFTYTNQESYRLDHIAHVELNDAKLDHSEFENFKDFYTSDWQRFVEYNIHDVNLVDSLEDKMKLIELAVTMAYDAKVNLEDVYSQVRMWDTLIYNDLKKRGIVVPPRITSKKDEKYAGAYVKEPKAGLYDWVVSFDLNSLYPHLIMQYNISPETLVDQRHPTATVDGLLNQEVSIGSGDYCVCANGAQYRKDILGFLPEMMQRIYDERTIYKKRMLAAKQALENSSSPAESEALQKDVSKFNNIQMARKIQLNSAYGAIGNEHFRYYRLEIAEAITMSGQLSIRWIQNHMNEYLNKLLSTEKEDYVIASDTDSIYLNLGPLVSKFFANKSSDKAAIVGILDKICQEKLEPFIERSYEELATYVAAYEQKMKMKRENIADRGIWTAKKRYILNVWDSEGVRYAEPKMKICGMETARSSTPAFFRDKLLKAYDIIINEDNDVLIDYIDKVKEDTKKEECVNIAFPRGVNGLKKYKSVSDIYSKGTPIHVRGALLYNHHVSRNKLTHKYPLIQEGEKIKFLYLKTPNPIQENVISFFQNLPPEFNVEKYVDFNKQFEKSFFEPLKNVLECIGWDYERSVSLLSFF